MHCITPNIYRDWLIMWLEFLRDSLCRRTEDEYGRHCTNLKRDKVIQREGMPYERSFLYIKPK